MRPQFGGRCPVLRQVEPLSNSEKRTLKILTGIFTMHKTTYNKDMKNLLSGINFATTALAAIEMKVMGYITFAVGAYQSDGNVDHVKAGAILLEGFNPKWKAPFFKAMRQIKACHTDFKIVVAPDVVAFTYTPIPKDKRPDTLPELQATLDVMLSEFLSTKRTREGRTDQEKEEAAIKSFVTAMTKSGRFEAGLNRLSIEQLEFAKDILAKVYEDRVKPSKPETEPTAPDVAEERNTGAEAKPASTDQLENLAETMTTTAH